MPRPRKPAALKAGKSESKQHLDARALIEDGLKGGTDLVNTYVPDNLDDIAKAYYKFILKELEAGGILANLDIPMLSQMAEALSMMDRLKEFYDTEGMIIYKTDRNGNTFPVENPAINTYMKYQTIFMKIATQFGLSPSARSNLAEMNMAQQAEDSDPLLRALNTFKEGAQ